MADPLNAYRRPGYPQFVNDERSYKTTIVYVGEYDTLEAAEPPANTTWGDYDGRVTNTNLVPIEGTSPRQGELTVNVEYFYEAGDQSGGGGTGTAAEVTHEVEWVEIWRPLLEHPQFAPGAGGANQLTDADLTAIEAWKNEQDPDLRKDYRYTIQSASGAATEAELSTNAKLLAKGILIGQEQWPDFAPVARRTTTYTDGPPSTSNAGRKDTPSSFPNLPAGYEYRKSADRNVQTGGRNTWSRVEEWTGAYKVLIDRDAVYWDAP